MIIRKIKLAVPSQKDPEPKRKAKKVAEVPTEEISKDWMDSVTAWAKKRGYVTERSEGAFRMDITPETEAEGWRAVVIQYLAESVDVSIFFGFNSDGLTRSIEFSRIPVDQVIGAMEYLFKGKDFYNGN